MTSRSKKTTATLELGWRVNPSLDPIYWLSNTAVAGGHDPSHLVAASAKELLNHTAIIAQSGSGKSFFLGRLIEEITLKTRANVVILDPNSDFRSISETDEPSAWDECGLEQMGLLPDGKTKRNNRLPTEKTSADFKAKWKLMTKKIRTLDKKCLGKPSYEKMSIGWWDLSMELLGEDLPTMKRHELSLCHGVAKSVYTLLLTCTELAGFEMVEDVINLAQKMKSINDFIDGLEGWLSKHKIQFKDEGVKDEPAVGKFWWSSCWLVDPFGQQRQQRSEEWFLSKSTGDSFYRDANTFTPEIFKFYTSVLRSMSGTVQLSNDKSHSWTGVFIRIHHLFGRHLKSEKVNDKSYTIPRIDVVDLPSIDRADRSVVVDAILNQIEAGARAEWQGALMKGRKEDTRVPTFIVVDEAHNYIPAEPRTRREIAVRDRFRTIVAEGRKFGLALIVVTQRPDKVDPMVLSQCENRALMKVNGIGTLQSSRKVLSLEEVPRRVLEKCVDCGKGRALLLGPWTTEGPVFMYTAMRRTKEGGRSLEDSHWAPSSIDSAPEPHPTSPLLPSNQDQPAATSPLPTVPPAPVATANPAAKVVSPKSVQSQTTKSSTKAHASQYKRNA